MTHPLTTWTPEEDATLAREWVKGTTAAAISRLLRTRTRCAVIGRKDRLGLPGRVKPSKPQPATRLRPAKLAPVSSVKAAPRPAGQHPRIGIKPVSPEVVEQRRADFFEQGQARIASLATAPINDNALRLMDRSLSQCAWPVGDPVRPAEQMCCGAKVMDDEDGNRLSYCQTHHALASNGKPVVKGIGREYARPGERRRVASVWDGGRAA